MRMEFMKAGRSFCYCQVRYYFNRGKNVVCPLIPLRQPRVLIFDEATANLDPQTAEHFARTINKLKGKVTMLFIAHQLPRGLQVDEVVTLGEHGAKVAVVREEG